MFFSWNTNNHLNKDYFSFIGSKSKLADHLIKNLKRLDFEFLKNELLKIIDKSGFKTT